MRHKPNQDRTISIGEAADALGLHRSTLSRQMKKGVFPSHNGRVRLDEVKRGRAKNLYQNRGDRWLGGPSLDASKSVAAGVANATSAYSATRAALVKIVSVAEEQIATAAVAAGASMPVAYTTAVIGRMELQRAADELLRSTDFIELHEDRDGPIKAPNWHALAALAGEAVDLEAWEGFCASRAWFKGEGAL